MSLFNVNRKLFISKFCLNKHQNEKFFYQSRHSLNSPWEFLKMDLNSKLSCEGFPPMDTSSSSQTGLDYPCAKAYNPCEDPRAKSKSSTLTHDDSSVKCLPVLGTSCTSSSMSSGILQQDCRLPKQPLPEPPNIAYELAVAKSIMQQYSTISGDNLFDHLSDIIKRVIDERPPNVIDFFEEFSRNVREQKLHLTERFPPDAVFEETRLYKVAKKQLMSMKLPYSEELEVEDGDIDEERNSKDDLKLELKLARFRPFYERVQHLQFFWNQCGFSISSDDVFQLACSMDRLQCHPSIMQCRFWGIINGLKASYYVVEASLTNEECKSRLLQMEKEILETKPDQNIEIIKNQKLPSHIGPELTPGAVGWENYPEEEILNMKRHALPVPLVKVVELFDVPPEPFGMGINRYTYFVVNSLSDDWIELPIVTPKQIIVSRQIKKFLTGDLETDVISYPYFPGKEKHYLRAMISRITAGSYIAPESYYRKMTKQEKRLFESGDDDEVENEGEEQEEESQISESDEEEDADNDIVLLKNEKYDPSIPLNTLNNPEKWVHVRPNILQQGRVVWYDEEKSRREREKERRRLEKLRMLEETGEDDEDGDEAESDEEEEHEGEETDLELDREIVPAILNPCSSDTNEETPVAWVGRVTSRYTNKNERILMMQSNVWPGAYTFIFENLCDSLYLGWGHKYVSRNMSWQHLTPIAEEYHHGPKDFIEVIDPSVEMEEAYRLSLIKKNSNITDMGEHLSDYENETHESTDDDDEEDVDEDEEEE